MTDSIALVGRTNVGKSLLFNKLVQYKNSIVLNKHGVTRDVNQGKLLYEDKYLHLYDTAGITSQDEQFTKLAYEKTLQAIDKSSVVLFVTSLEDGVTSSDKEICSILRKLNKEIILVINKSDKQKSILKKYEFSELGINNSFEVSAKTNKGLLDLIKKTFSLTNSGIYSEIKTNRIAFIGKPNVGKSTLFNRLTQRRQAIVDSVSGVTRDRHYGISDWNGRDFTVIDTGGYITGSEDIFEAEIRKQVKIAVEESDCIIFVVDVETGTTDLDMDVAQILRKANKPVFIAVNKVDNAMRMDDAMEFYNLGLGEYFAISSINGSGTGDLLDAVVNSFSKEGKRETNELPKFAIVGRPNSGKYNCRNLIW